MSTDFNNDNIDKAMDKILGSTDLLDYRCSQKGILSVIG